MTTTESPVDAAGAVIPFQEHVTIDAHDLAQLLGSSARPTQIWVEPGTLRVHIQGEAPDVGDARTRYPRYRVMPGGEVQSWPARTHTLVVSGDDAELDRAVAAVTRCCYRVTIVRQLGEPDTVRFTVLSNTELDLITEALAGLAR